MLAKKTQQSKEKSEKSAICVVLLLFSPCVGWKESDTHDKCLVKFGKSHGGACVPHSVIEGQTLVAWSVS